MPVTFEYVFSFAAAVIFALISFYAFRLLQFTEHHKRRVLSFFGGVIAAYVFLDLLPSLELAGVYLKQVAGESQLVSVYQDAIFLVVFVGFLLFFVLEHFAKRSRIRKQALTQKDYSQTAAAKKLFIVHFISYAFMNLILSYLLIFEFQTGLITGLLYTFAIAMHFFISSDDMVEHYKQYQISFGRYIAALMPLAGWASSMLFPEHLAEVYIMLAFISGTILYTSIKNEIPSAPKKQSLTLFLIGAAFYTVLLLAHAIIAA